MERIAININDARIPDSLGLQPIDEAVITGGPAAYFSTLPIKAMVQALHTEGLVADVSQTAGTLVCNHVFYRLMRSLAAHRLSGGSIRGGSIHVPPLGDGTAAAMSLEDMTRGLTLAIECALTTPVDTVVLGGSIG